MNQYELGFKQGYDRAGKEWLDKVKQAISEVSNLRLESAIKGDIIDDEIYIDSMTVLKILDKLIAESEGANDSKANNVAMSHPIQKV